MADFRKADSDIKEKLVAINRITKVVKGGRRFGFAALMVVGKLHLRFLHYGLEYFQK